MQAMILNPQQVFHHLQPLVQAQAVFRGARPILPSNEGLCYGMNFSAHPPSPNGDLDTVFDAPGGRFVSSTINGSSRSFPHTPEGGIPADIRRITKQSGPTYSEVQRVGVQRLSSVGEDSDSDSEISTHPNKYPIEIEEHGNRSCRYIRHGSRSGPKIKQRLENVYNQYTGKTEQQIQTIKYYQKELVRICHCGRYDDMEGALHVGRTNDCIGYEIHYSQKCKWKAYEDFKTKKRVLIRLCKCYKP